MCISAPRVARLSSSQTELKMSMRSVRSNTRRSSTTQSLSGTSANLLSVVAGTQQARSVDGVRVLQREGTLGIQYLVSLEDETRVWLPNECVADDLRSQYGLEWWNACRQGDQATLEKFLSTSSGTLLHSKDSKQRRYIADGEMKRIYNKYCLAPFIFLQGLAIHSFLTDC